MNRVPYLSTPRWDDLYEHQSASIPFGSGVHNFQELDDYCHCIWRGVVVRRQRYSVCPLLFRAYGSLVCGSCLGGYPACVIRTSGDQGIRCRPGTFDFECWICVDGNERFLHSRICSVNEEGYQEDELQGLGQYVA